ncbi:MAG TPA: hypothetical protein DEP53_09155 [Bacteroidetes bacterium]|nr:hypothetical protein [Bacteroidota bacterium]
MKNLFAACDVRKQKHFFREAATKENEFTRRSRNDCESVLQLSQVRSEKSVSRLRKKCLASRHSNRN